jgi:hypothetical protein
MKNSERVAPAVAMVTMTVLVAFYSSYSSDNSGDAARKDADVVRDERKGPGAARFKETVVPVMVAAGPPPDIGAGTNTTSDLGPPRVAESVADLLRQYLRSEFGRPESQAPWYDRVRRVTVGLQTAAIHTDLSSDTGDIATAQAVCRAVSTFPNSTEGRHVTALDVDVYGTDGRLLASQRQARAQPSSRSRPGLRPLHVPQHNSPVFAHSPSPEPPSRSNTVDRDR